jgi:hypothetical protein
LIFKGRIPRNLFIASRYIPADAKTECVTRKNGRRVTFQPSCSRSLARASHHVRVSTYATMLTRDITAAFTQLRVPGTCAVRRQSIWNDYAPVQGTCAARPLSMVSDLVHAPRTTELWSYRRGDFLFITIMFCDDVMVVTAWWPINLEWKRLPAASKPRTSAV